MSDETGRLSSRVDILRNLHYSPQFHVAEVVGSGTDTCVTPDSLSDDGMAAYPMAHATSRHLALNLWLGQYSDYDDHLHDDLLHMHRRQRKASDNVAMDHVEVPGKPDSNTPTAASVVFSIPYVIPSNCDSGICPAHASPDTNSSSLHVLVAAGKALSEREMLVRITSYRGKIHKLLSYEMLVPDLIVKYLILS